MSTPAERSVIARIAANTRWANETNRTGVTAKARENSPASITYWLSQVDPDRVMTGEDRLKAAENKKKAYYERFARNGRKAKAAKRAAGGAA